MIVCVDQMSSWVVLVEQCLRSHEIMLAVPHNTMQLLKYSKMELCVLVEAAKLA